MLSVLVDNVVSVIGLFSGQDALRVLFRKSVNEKEIEMGREQGLKETLLEMAKQIDDEG